MFGLTRYNPNNQMGTINPFKEMDEFEKSFFDHPFGSFYNMPEFSAFKTDVLDEGSYYQLEADLPGFDKKDIHLSLNGDLLTVQAERHSKVDEKNEKDKIVRMERSYGSYSRSFDVSDINVDEIKAKYENGVLMLTLPKKGPDEDVSRTFEIE